MRVGPKSNIFSIPATRDQFGRQDKRHIGKRCEDREETKRHIDKPQRAKDYQHSSEIRRLKDSCFPEAFGGIMSFTTT